MNKIWDVIVAGGGASGLTAAIFAARSGAKVLLLEKLPKAGKKLSVTGNGRCNFANEKVTSDSYRGLDPSFAWAVLEQFGKEELLSFFEELGVPAISRDCCYYPMSRQASSVRTALLRECDRLHVTMKTNMSVEEVCYMGNCFKVTTRDGVSPDLSSAAGESIRRGQVLGSTLILATGGRAGKNMGCDGSGYALAESFGHRISSLWPALTGVEGAKKTFFSTAAGVRVMGSATLFSGDHRVYTAKGEIQFYEKGLSGIPLFSLSHYVGELLDKGQCAEIRADFVPELSERRLSALLTTMMKEKGCPSLIDALLGILPEKLAVALVQEGNLLHIENPTLEQIQSLAGCCKNWKMEVTALRGYEQAQVTAGGVHTREVEPATMASKLRSGLYLTGELLDIDGDCGGYNLQFAFGSGALAGRAAAAYAKKKN